jgi:hypothetical protein
MVLPFEFTWKEIGFEIANLTLGDYIVSIETPENTIFVEGKHYDHESDVKSVMVGVVEQGVITSTYFFTKSMQDEAFMSARPDINVQHLIESGLIKRHS